jgi:hypothetical protein
MHDLLSEWRYQLRVQIDRHREMLLLFKNINNAYSKVEEELKRTVKSTYDYAQKQKVKNVIMRVCYTTTLGINL